MHNHPPIQLDRRPWTGVMAVARAFSTSMCIAPFAIPPTVLLLKDLCGTAKFFLDSLFGKPLVEKPNGSANGAFFPSVCESAGTHDDRLGILSANGSVIRIGTKRRCRFIHFSAPNTHAVSDSTPQPNSESDRTEYHASCFLQIGCFGKTKKRQKEQNI